MIDIRKSDAVGYIIGVLFVIMLILIIIGFVKLTWGFWLKMARIAELDKAFPHIFGGE